MTDFPKIHLKTYYKMRQLQGLSYSGISIFGMEIEVHVLHRTT